eukprot:6183766-Pleurochrysis_carterae.AAC.2
MHAATKATLVARVSAAFTLCSYRLAASCSAEKSRSVRSEPRQRCASAVASASASCTALCFDLTLCPAAREKSTAGGKTDTANAHNDGESDTIIAAQPTIISAPRAPATRCVVTTFCSAAVSAESRLSSSPVRWLSKKASSCRNSDSNALVRSRAATRSPATASSCERPATRTACSVKSASNAPAAAWGVQLGSALRHWSSTAPAAFGKDTEMTELLASSARPIPSSLRSGYTNGKLRCQIVRRSPLLESGFSASAVSSPTLVTNGGCPELDAVFDG